MTLIMPYTTFAISNMTTQIFQFLDFTNWAFYRKEGGKYTPDDIDINLCTHIVYGFAVLDKNTFKMIAHDSYVDEDKGIKQTIL